MAIQVRSFKPFDLVLSFDAALDEIEQDVVEEYVRARDIEVLGLDKRPGVQPTIFSCSHLTPEDDFMIGQFLSDDMRLSAGRQIVKTHVHGVKNLTFDGISNPVQPGSGNRTRLKDEAIDQLPTRAILEIAAVLVTQTNGADYRPFSSVGTWQREREERARDTARAAVTAALGEPAKA